MRILEAKVLAVDDVHVHICCPICGTLHKHGSSGDIGKQNYGYRLAHCGSRELPGVEGSFWDNPEDNGYELICTPETMRQNKDASRYISRWYKESRFADYKKESRKIAQEIMKMTKEHLITKEEAYNQIMRKKKTENSIF